MKSGIDKAFGQARSEKRAAFIPYVTAGFPDLSTCVEVLVALDRGGSDVIEVGLPFSDPLADGPTIQAAGRTALDAGITVDKVFEIVSEAKQRISAPVVLMTYVNPVFRIGYAEFASRASAVGSDGVIIPDLPPEEADEWLEAAARHNLDTIFLVAPNTDLRRVEEVAALSKGFLYYVSMTGVTGSSFSVSSGLLDGVHAVRSVSSVPVAVGFGISSPDQGRVLATAADGVIVGSALIRELQSHPNPEAQVQAAEHMASGFREAMGRGLGNTPQPHHHESKLSVESRTGGHLS